MTRMAFDSDCSPFKSLVVHNISAFSPYHISVALSGLFPSFLWKEMQNTPHPRHFRQGNYPVYNRWNCW